MTVLTDKKHSVIETAAVSTFLALLCVVTVYSLKSTCFINVLNANQGLIWTSAAILIVSILSLDVSMLLCFKGKHRNIKCIVGAAVVTLLIWAVSFGIFSSINLQESEYKDIGVSVGLTAMALLLLYASTLIVIIKKNRLSADSFFIVTVVFFTVEYLILFPPWSVPDAKAHFAAAYRFSSLILGTVKNGIVCGRQGDMSFLGEIWKEFENPSLQSYSWIVDGFNLPFVDKAIVELSDEYSMMNCYSALNYLPQTMGLVIGRLLNLGTVPCIYLGRLFISVAYVLGCWHAVRITPVAKGAFCILPLLPMCLMMGNSYSYDAMVYITVFCYSANILALYETGDKKRLLEASAWAVFLGTVKSGAYLSFLPLALIVLVKTTERSKKLRTVLPVICSAVLSFLVFRYVFHGNDAMFQLGNDESGALKASFALSNPMAYVKMCIYTYVFRLDFLFYTMLGSELSWLEDTLPTLLLTMFLLLAFIYSLAEKDKLELDYKTSFVFLAIIGIVLICTPAMLLSWTGEGSTTVQGLQGRYYTPALLAVIILATKYSTNARLIRENNPEIMGKIQTSCLLIAAALSSLFIYYLLGMYLTR